MLLVLPPLLPVSATTSLHSLPFPSSLQPEVQMNAAPTSPSNRLTEDEATGLRTVEVAIPNVGTFVIETEEGGYDDKVAVATTNHLLLYFFVHSVAFTGFFTLEETCMVLIDS